MSWATNDTMWRQANERQAELRREADALRLARQVRRRRKTRGNRTGWFRKVLTGPLRHA